MYYEISSSGNDELVRASLFYTSICSVSWQLEGSSPRARRSNNIGNENYNYFRINDT